MKNVRKSSRRKRRNNTADTIDKMGEAAIAELGRPKAEFDLCHTQQCVLRNLRAETMLGKAANRAAYR